MRLFRWYAGSTTQAHSLAAADLCESYISSGGNRVRRSWLILSMGFGIVIALIALLGFGAMRRARTINDEMIAAHQKYLQTEAVLNEIPAGLYLADILVRDISWTLRNRRRRIIVNS